MPAARTGWSHWCEHDTPWFMISFRIRGVDPAQFQQLFGLTDAELRVRNVYRYVAEQGSMHPDRVELRHALADERVLLVNYEHQPAKTPYRASHAIYVLEGAARAAEFVDTIPEPLRIRLLSLRAYDADDMITDATVTEGTNGEAAIEKLFENEHVAYIHAHFAARGCYAAYIERA